MVQRLGAEVIFGPPCISNSPAARAMPPPSHAPPQVKPRPLDLRPQYEGECQSRATTPPPRLAVYPLPTPAMPPARKAAHQGQHTATGCGEAEAVARTQLAIAEVMARVHLLAQHRKAQQQRALVELQLGEEGARTRVALGEVMERTRLRCALAKPARPAQNQGDAGAPGATLGYVRGEPLEECPSLVAKLLGYRVGEPVEGSPFGVSLCDPPRDVFGSPAEGLLGNQPANSPAEPWDAVPGGSLGGSRGCSVGAPGGALQVTLGACEDRTEVLEFAGRGPLGHSSYAGSACGTPQSLRGFRGASPSTCSVTPPRSQDTSRGTSATSSAGSLQSGCGSGPGSGRASPARVHHVEPLAPLPRPLASPELGAGVSVQRPAACDVPWPRATSRLLGRPAAAGRSESDSGQRGRRGPSPSQGMASGLRFSCAYPDCSHAFRPSPRPHKASRRAHLVVVRGQGTNPRLRKTHVERMCTLPSPDGVGIVQHIAGIVYLCANHISAMRGAALRPSA